MQDRIDLQPLFAQRDAAEILLLARGQLNRAFRHHGLQPPDQLVPADGDASVTRDELEDPARLGVDAAASRFGAAFWDWAFSLKLDIAVPLLAILEQTLQRDVSAGYRGSTRRALVVAHAFLLCRIDDDRDQATPAPAQDRRNLT